MRHAVLVAVDGDALGLGGPLGGLGGGGGGGEQSRHEDSTEHRFGEGIVEKLLQ
jgi:hypothetical protein